VRIGKSLCPVVPEVYYQHELQLTAVAVDMRRWYRLIAGLSNLMSPVSTVGHPRH
jgi:hypothetical protein